MVGSTISHYAPKAHPRSVAEALERKRPLADKILEKFRQADGGQVGEVPIRLNLATPTCRGKLSSSVGLCIPLNESTDSSSRRPSLGGSGKEAVL